MSNFQDLLTKSRGYGAVEKKEQESEEKQKSFVNRFYLKAGSEAKIVFLDDNPPVIEEHQLQINGDWRNWFTCKRLLNEPCIICEELKDNPYTVGFYTILDLTEYTIQKGARKGEVIKNSVKLFTPKLKALNLIKRQSQKRGGLELCVFDVYRSSADAFNVGDSFEFETKVTWDEIKQLNADAAPFDYAEILEPKTDGELKRIFNRNTQSNLDTGVGDYEESADEVDF